MHIAQFNIAEAIDERDSEVMADFFNNIERINAAADRHEGFIWRFDDDAREDLFSETAYGSSFILVNMSVWQDRDSLFRFVYQSEHLEVYKRKKDWFHKMPRMHMVMWYVPMGHIPTLEEGKERLEYLQKHGESKYAFSFKSRF